MASPIPFLVNHHNFDKSWSNPFLSQYPASFFVYRWYTDTNLKCQSPLLLIMIDTDKRYFATVASLIAHSIVLHAYHYSCFNLSLCHVQLARYQCKTTVPMTFTGLIAIRSCTLIYRAPLVCGIPFTYGYIYIYIYWVFPVLDHTIGLPNLEVWTVLSANPLDDGW